MEPRRQTSDTERLLRHALTKVEEFVQQGEEHAAALVFKENPALANDQESAIEIIYAEFLALEARGRLPDSNSWLDRFPAHRPRLERLLKLHDFLSNDQPASINALAGSNSARSHLSGNESADHRNPEQDVAAQPFANYELLHEIGRGGMGIVYRARQHGLGRIVALKALRSIESHPKVRLRFQQEAETVASLQHPNIVQIIETSLEAGKEFLSMEYLGGGSLDTKLQDESWSNHEIAELIQTLAKAAHYAHERGIIHRDLKPANILFTTERTPKIVDFGLAKKIQDELHATVTGAVLGTPCYMSPEQAAGNDSSIGISTDIYSLGVILYQMLTKRLPFEGKTAIETLRWIVDRECEPPSRIVHSIPRDLETICLKCLAKSPNGRYTTAQELAEDLARFLDHIPVHARRANWIERLNRRIRRHPQVAALAASIVVVIMGASALLLYQNRNVDRLSRENARHAIVEARLENRVTEAEDAYEASLKKARASVNEWTQLGLRLDNAPGMDGLRRKAFEDAIAYYRECLSTDQVNDTIRIEAAVAAVRAGNFHFELGQYETAEAELRQAENWLKPLAPEVNVTWNRADIQILLAHILRRVDRWEESKQAYENGIKLVGELLQSAPNSSSYLIRQSNALVNLCVVYKYQGKLEECLPLYVRAIRLSTKAAAIRTKQPIPDFLALDKSFELNEIQPALNEVTDFLDCMCKQLQDRSPALFSSLAKEGYLSEIALSLDDLGQVFVISSQNSLAEQSYREAIRLRILTQDLAQDNRRIEQYIARSETNLGELLLSNDRFEEARECLHAAESAYSKLVEDFPDRTDFRAEWSHCLIVIAKCSRIQQEFSMAAKYADLAAKQTQFVYKRSNSLTDRDNLAWDMLILSHFLRLSGEMEQANIEFENAKKLAMDRFQPCNSYAWLLALEDHWTESIENTALEFSKTATRILPQSPAPWNTRALVLARSELWKESLEAIETAIRLRNGDSASDWYIKSMALAGSGDFEAARHWFSTAEELRKSKSLNHSELRQVAKFAESLLAPYK